MDSSTMNIPVDNSWRPLRRVAAVAAFLMAIIIPIQTYVYVAFPPPVSAEGFLALFQENWLLGLLSLDLLYLVDNFLAIFVYLGLFAALARRNLAYSTLAAALSLVGISAYFSSNTAFEMLALSHAYADATSVAARTAAVGAAQAMLATYTGTAFNVYYIFSALALLTFSIVMLDGNELPRAAAYLGIAAGLLMLVPSTAGTAGLICSLAFIPVWFAWLIIFGDRMRRL